MEKTVPVFRVTALFYAKSGQPITDKSRSNGLSATAFVLFLLLKMSNTLPVKGEGDWLIDKIKYKQGR